MRVSRLIMAVLAVSAVEPIDGHAGLAAATERLRQLNPALVTGPGPANYLPIGLGFSFFLMWSLMSPGQPSGMVRLMAFRDVPSLRRATSPCRTRRGHHSSSNGCPATRRRRGPSSLR